MRYKNKKAMVRLPNRETYYFDIVAGVIQKDTLAPSVVAYSYADSCRNIFNSIKTSGHSSLEKYTSHFIWKGAKGCTKGIICERWVGDWTELQHIDPSTLPATAAFLSRSPGLLNRGPGGPASAGTWFSFQHLFSNSSELPVAGVI